MEHNVQIKLEWENSLRRTSVLRTETLVGVKRTVARLLDLDEAAPLELTYKDEEGDIITIGSDFEMQQLLDEAAASKKSLRLNLAVSADGLGDDTEEDDVLPAEDEEEEEDVEEDEVKDGSSEPFPFANVARALSDRDTVGRVLAVLQSDTIVSAVSAYASAYSENHGNQAAAGVSVLPHVPALLGVLAQLVEELPVLKDLQNHFLAKMASFADPSTSECRRRRHHGCHGHGRRHGHRGHHGHHGPHHGGHHRHGGHCVPHPRPHGPHGHHPHHGRPHFPFGFPFGGPFGPEGHSGGRGPCVRGPCEQGDGQLPFGQAHFGIICDGCSSDGSLKQQAQQAGNVSRRGFIRGQRYKSNVIADFDLCEACHANTDRFPESVYGPFTVIAPPAGQRWGWRGQGHAGPWRRQEGSTEKDVPIAEPVQSKPQAWDGLMNAFKQAMSQGAQAFSQAATEAQGEGGELAEIARAIAESLKETKPTTPTQAEAPVQRVGAPAASPSASVATGTDLFTKWAKELRQLESLGFDKSETYLEFLEEEKGDLERVVNRIVRRDM